MNNELKRAHAHRLAEGGLEPDFIGERLGIHRNYADQLLSGQPKLPVNCHRCGVVLSYHTAYRLGGHDFCKSCRRELFADIHKASIEYPTLFGRGEEP